LDEVPGIAAGTHLWSVELQTGKPFAGWYQPVHVGSARHVPVSPVLAGQGEAVVGQVTPSTSSTDAWDPGVLNVNPGSLLLVSPQPVGDVSPLIV
jgi:hypothetical protein